MSRITLSKRIAEKAENMKNQIKNILKDQDYISLTIDLWTSVSKEHFIGVTAHFITEKWEMNHLTLHVEEIQDYSDTSTNNIINMLPRILDDYNISHKIVSITCDEGRDINFALNEIKSTNSNKFLQFSCIAHRLSTVIRTSMKKDQLIDKLINIANHFSMSYKNTNSLLLTTELKNKMNTFSNNVYNFDENIIEDESDNYEIEDDSIEEDNYIDLNKSLNNESSSFISEVSNNSNNSNTSNKIHTNLFNQLKIPKYKRLIKLPATRWKGIIKVIESYLSLRISIISVLNSTNKQLILKNEEDAAILDYYIILKQIEILFNISESENQPNITIIPYSIVFVTNNLKKLLDSVEIKNNFDFIENFELNNKTNFDQLKLTTEKGKKLAENIINLLNNKFDSYSIEILLCMLLNPEYKSSISNIISENHTNMLKDFFFKEFDSFYKRANNLTTEINNDSNNPLNKLHRFLHKNIEDNSQTLSINEPIKYIEIVNEINIGAFNTKKLLHWWYINSDNFPIVSKIARKYLCIQPSSSSIERTWSIATNICTKKRNKLSSETLQSLIILKSNEHIINIY